VRVWRRLASVACDDRAVQLAAFTAASVLLAVTPGPGMLYIATRTLADGRRAGFASVAGVAAGNLVNAAAAALGLAALLAAWPAGYQVLRAAGGAVLLWLAVSAWRGSPPKSPATADPSTGDGAQSLAGAWRQGFWVALLNPKTALFFAAFLPPFLDPALPAAPQSLALGGLFVAIAALSDVAVVLAAGALATRLRSDRNARAGRALAAAVYAALGLYALLG
jgi:threonine/homoserine/homoserine lactone efflux protein